MKNSLSRWVNSDINIDSKYLQSTDPQLLNKAQSYKHAVMHEWERPIMELDAKFITQKGGRILNIGHGMGIIDSYIKASNPEHHTIVEIHPQIVERAKTQGYKDVWEGDWVDFIKECNLKNVKYDGIYFDTYCFERFEWKLFTQIVTTILNPGGIYSYFNGGAAKFQKIKEYLIELGWSYNEKQIEVTSILLEFGKEIPTPQIHTCIWWEKPINP
jgi:protein arginine N-methyltransferase 2|tara:strand:- start:544 stop:1188 length:645 start_codon:yes stop_codon:yes gene_type:complete